MGAPSIAPSGIETYVPVVATAGRYVPSIAPSGIETNRNDVAVWAFIDLQSHLRVLKLFYVRRLQSC